MSSTNKTANYNLSQFIGTDKPAWLSDYNQDMSKIDTGIKNASDAASAADGKADANTTSIGNLSNLTTTAKTNLVAAVNEVKADAGTAQGSANTAIDKANANTAAINALAGTLNINTYLEYTSANATATGGTIGAGELYVARNSDGSLFKVYGNILFTPNGSGDKVITLSTTGVAAPESAYNIQGCGFGFGANNAIRPMAITVNTNGTLQIKWTAQSTDGTTAIRLLACLYFNSDFGDITPEE